MRILMFSFETLFVFFLFLFTDIRAYGKENKRFPLLLSVLISSLVLTSLNALFFTGSHWFSMLLTLVTAIGILLTLFFIDTHVIYSVSLQLELVCCCTELKTIWFLTIAMMRPDFTEDPKAVVLFYLLFALSMITCSYFLSRFSLKAPSDHPNKYFVTITVIPLILLILNNLYLYDGLQYTVQGLCMSLMVIALLLITHYLSYLHIASYNELLESRAITQHMNLLQSHVERSSALVEQIRRDKHEMKNVYFYIYSLLEDKNYNELSEFVQTKLLHRYDRLEEFNTGCKIIDYLLSQMAWEAVDAGIPFVADIRLPEQLYIDKNDLCSLLQNLLDNAIDASKKEAERDLLIKMTQQKNYLAITVKNRSSTDVLETNPGLLTTKPDKDTHGIGTRVIRKIVEKYDGAIDYSMEEGYFVVNVLLLND